MLTLVAPAESAPALIAAPRRLDAGTVAALGVIVAIYLALAFSIARVKAPWCDEGWFACPAYNLEAHGFMGTNVLEPSGHYLNAYLRGIEQRTYVTPPLYLVTLAGWFRVFGFSAMSMRAYSILWGAVALLAIFAIAFRLCGRRVALLAASLSSVDFIFIWGATDGRMDMMCAALGLCALAVYLALHKSNLTRAIAVSQGLAAAAVFTHPNGILAVLALMFLAWQGDRGRLAWRHAALAAAPYVAFAAAWGIYIIQSPADFEAQFFANAAGRNAVRWRMLWHPWTAISNEASKYFTGYGVYPIWTGRVFRPLALVPAIYGLALIAYARRGNRALLSIAAVELLGMTFLVGFKAQNYLTYVVPLHNVILAAWLVRAPRGLAALAAAVFLTVELSALAQKIQANEYAREYRPVIERLENDRQLGKTIIGTSALGFDFGFAGFRDDARLGRYSGRTTDVIVLDPSYRQWFKLFEKQERPVYVYVSDLMRRRYHSVYRGELFEILERNQPVAAKEPHAKDRSTR